jgi:hypothetical protein
LFQPIASDDVCRFISKYALKDPINSNVEIAGPERFKLFEIVTQYLRNVNDTRTVVCNGKPEYYGGAISHADLVPAGAAELGSIRFEKWWRGQTTRSQANKYSHYKN